jgi:hypothetical protein
MIAEDIDIDLSWVAFDDSPIQCENSNVDGIEDNKCPNQAVWQIYMSGCECSRCHCCDDCLGWLLVRRDDLYCVTHLKLIRLVHWEKIKA